MPTEKQDDGGPAFPQHGWSRDPDVVARMQAVQGMTLWDYYAASALTGELASQHSGDVWSRDVFDRLAARSADIADAMLAERRRRGIGG